VINVVARARKGRVDVCSVEEEYEIYARRCRPGERRATEQAWERKSGRVDEVR